MIAIIDHEEGCVIPVRARSGARRSGVLKVAVTAPAQDGRANEALAETLREAFGVRRSQVELIGGLTGREKRFLIRGMKRAELERRLQKVMTG
jgi:uncharacterized protein